MYNHISRVLAAVLILPAALSAQNLRFAADENQPKTILPTADTIRLHYNGDMVTVPVMANCDYTANLPESDWLQCIKEKNGNLTFIADYWYDAIFSRSETINLVSTDNSYTRPVVVMQSPNTSANELPEDTRLTVVSAEANSSQGGEGIERTYDNNTNTLWHSPYSGGLFPYVLTYTLKDSPDVDYVLYTPRPTGDNGLFGRVKVECNLTSAPGNWVEVADTDLNQTASSARIKFNQTAKGVHQVRITVYNGKNNYASCAEMGFYQTNSEIARSMNLFKDGICSALKDDVAQADINGITVPYFRQLAEYMHSGNYSTEFRVGEFEAFKPVDDLQRELRTSSAYNRYENPTGIYFTKDELIVLFVEGIGKDGVSLIIKSFGPSQYDGDNQPESSYTLSNGLNVIRTKNRGNGYISYFTEDYATAPKVKIHFAMTTENGYFSLEKGHTNADWKRFLANATSDIFDVYTRRLHAAVTLEALNRSCPEKGEELATLFNAVVAREWEIMGLEKNNRVPKNRQFVRAVPNGFMFADGIGAGVQYASVPAICNPNDMDIWGLGHELGHNNQVTPGFKWSGCGETTNNIYASWAQHKEGTGYHRLEDENSGIGEYGGWRGGRFQVYLEEGVRKGISWQLQDGPDYHGATPESKSVAEEDYNGNQTGKYVTTTSRNYDHFVKVVPFYQLALFGIDAGKAPDMYAEAFESFRTDYIADAMLSNGQRQVKAMKRFCDGAKLNLLPFFEKAGLFKPVNAYIEDYSAGWLKINQAMLDELKAHVEAQGYPEAPAALNYINGYNWEIFRDEAKLVQNEVGAGCTAYRDYVDIEHSAWKNVVGFETYNAKGELIRITMYGLGKAQKSKNATRVLFPSSEKAAYIMAVGYDGTKFKCYED